MGFMFGIDGRIGRGKWWLGQLAVLVILVISVFASAISIDLDSPFGDLNHQQLWTLGIGVLVAAFFNVCLCVKRYHDRGKSGFWFFICFIPYVGALWQFAELGFLRGEQGANKYDDDSSRTARRAPDFGGEPSYAGFGDIDAKIEAMKRSQYVAASAPVAKLAPANVNPVQRSPGFGRRGLS